MLLQPLKRSSLASTFLALATLVNAADPIVSHTPPFASFGHIERRSSELDLLLDKDAKMEVLAEGFDWAEGPVWVPKQQELLFSDVPQNIVYRWRESGGVSVFLTPSGFTGESYDGKERGSNGLTLDPSGDLVLAQHGDRRIARLDRDGHSFVTVAERFQGKRFNSPNDLCFDRAGNLYFTDPPYGLAKSATREIDFHGVYRASRDGQVALLTRTLDRPNGIALSPDERTLYVANSSPDRRVIMAFTLSPDGTLHDERVFFDASSVTTPERQGLPDGLKVDQEGNLWATGPGGVLVISSSSEHLGTLVTGKFTANCAFGDDGSTLYITADNLLLRVRTRVKGTGF